MNPQKYNDILEEEGYAQAEEYKRQCEESEADQVYSDYLDSWSNLDVRQLAHLRRFVKRGTLD